MESDKAAAPLSLVGALASAGAIFALLGVLVGLGLLGARLGWANPQSSLDPHPCPDPLIHAYHGSCARFRGGETVEPENPTSPTQPPPIYVPPPQPVGSRGDDFAITCVNTAAGHNVTIGPMWWRYDYEPETTRRRYPRVENRYSGVRDDLTPPSGVAPWYTKQLLNSVPTDATAPWGRWPPSYPPPQGAPSLFPDYRMPYLWSGTPVETTSASSGDASTGWTHVLVRDKSADVFPTGSWYDASRFSADEWALFWWAFDHTGGHTYAGPSGSDYGGWWPPIRCGPPPLDELPENVTVCRNNAGQVEVGWTAPTGDAREQGDAPVLHCAYAYSTAPPRNHRNCRDCRNSRQGCETLARYATFETDQARAARLG